MSQSRRILAVAGVFVVAAVAFAVLAVAVAHRSGPLGPDASVLRDVVDWRSGGLTFLAKALTALGTDVAVYSALIAGALVCAWRKERPYAGVLAVAILITGQLVRLGINHEIARPRPPAALRLVHAGGFAFPSGHTTLATLAYGLLAILLSVSFPRYRWLFAAAGRRARVRCWAVPRLSGGALDHRRRRRMAARDLLAGSRRCLDLFDSGARRGLPAGQLSLENRPHEGALVAQDATALVAYPVSGNEIGIDSEKLAVALVLRQ